MSDNNKQLRIALFLGAGASVPFGKPTTKKLKNDLIKEYEKLVEELIGKYAGKSNLEVDELLIRKYLLSILRFNKFDDIEHVLQALKEIDDFFAEPRYGGRYLHTLITGKYGDRISTDSVNDYSFSGYVKTISEQRRRIEKRIFDFYRWDRTKDEALSQIYGRLFAEIKKHSNNIHIFTTNYDRAIEQYCMDKNRGYRCNDGFKTDDSSGGLRLWHKNNYNVPSVQEGVTHVILYKIHGSLNWKNHEPYGIEAIGGEGHVTDPSYTKDMLIYPTLSPKDGQELEPYSIIREMFKDFMEKTDVCIVIGFSFRDEHINLIFSDFLKFGRRTLIVVSRSAEKCIDENLLRKYEHELPKAEKTPWSDDENITIYDVNGTNIIAINYNMTVEDAEKIVRQKIGPHLSSMK